MNTLARIPPRRLPPRPEPRAPKAPAAEERSLPPPPPIALALVPPAPASVPAPAPAAAAPVPAPPPPSPCPPVVASVPILVAPIVAPIIRLAPAVAKPPPPIPAIRAQIAQRIDAAFLVPEDETDWDIGAVGLTDLRAAQKNTTEARLRRAHLTKYVKGVVGACGVVCLLAVVRVAVTSASAEPPVAPARATAALPVPVPVAAPERVDTAPTMTSALATNTHGSGKGDRAHYARRHGR